MAAIVQGSKDLVADGSWNHVYDDIGGCVVGFRGADVMEGGCGAAFNNIVEMDIEAFLDQFAGDEGADEASTEAMNSHATGFMRRDSKVALPMLCPFSTAKAIINHEGMGVS